MDISVIVATWNRAAMLERLLRALSAQTLPSSEFEILVVLDGCTDGSRGLCEAMQGRLPNLRVIERAQQGGQVYALNDARKIAEGAKLAFTDDDCIPDPDWLERLAAALETHELVAGAVRTPEKPFYLLCHNIAQLHAFLPGRRGPRTTFVAGTNFGCRRAWLEQMGGFDSHPARSFAPDMTLALKGMTKGCSFCFAADAVVCHIPQRTTFGTLMRYAAVHSRQTIVLRQEFESALHTPWVLRSALPLALASPLIALQVTLQMYLLNPSLRRHLHTVPVVYMIKLAWCYGAVMGLLGR